MIRLVTEIPAKAREWRNDPRVMRWCRQNEMITAEDQRRWEERTKTDPTIRMFGIEAEGTTESYTSTPIKTWTPIGVCGLTSINRNHRHGEFSLYIAPEWQGKGYGKKALFGLLHYGFYNVGLEYIWGESFVGNPAIRLFESLGFRTTGTSVGKYEKGGRRVDCVQIEMTREEFRARNPI